MCTEQCRQRTLYVGSGSEMTNVLLFLNIVSLAYTQHLTLITSTGWVWSQSSQVQQTATLQPCFAASRLNDVITTSTSGVDTWRHSIGELDTVRSRLCWV